MFRISFVFVATVILGCTHAAKAPDSSNVTIRLLDESGAPIDTSKPILRTRRIRLAIEGLPLDKKIIVEARDGKGRWRAQYPFNSRVLDFATDPDGWIYRMSPAPARPVGATTVEVKVFALNHDPPEHILTETALNESSSPQSIDHKNHEDGSIAQLRFERTDTPEGVTLHPVSESGVLGDLVLPPGDGPFPAIIVLGGSEGGNAVSLRRALDLCGSGYAALALTYFGESGLEETIRMIPTERVDLAAAWLRKQPRIDGTRLAIIGESRGGELALMAGHFVPGVKGVVALVPSGLRWGAMRNPNEPGWTRAGKPLPFVPWSGVMPSVEQDEDRTFLTTLPVFTSSIEKATVAQLEAATIPVEQIKGPVLLIAGESDQLWPSCDLAQVAYERLEKTGHRKRFTDEMVCLSGVGHRIGVPGGSTIGHADNVDGKMVVRMGGNPKAIAMAEHQVRDLIQRFLADALRSPFPLENSPRL